MWRCVVRGYRDMNVSRSAGTRRKPVVTMKLVEMKQADGTVFQSLAMQKWRVPFSWKFNKIKGSSHLCVPHWQWSWCNCKLQMCMLFINKLFFFGRIRGLTQGSLLDKGSTTWATSLVMSVHVFYGNHRKRNWSEFMYFIYTVEECLFILTTQGRLELWLTDATQSCKRGSYFILSTAQEKIKIQNSKYQKQEKCYVIIS
jgi:hypothetical protein